MVGRLTGLARLRDALRRATGGDRAIVLVTGEAGIGKSTLIEQFLAGIGAGDRESIAHGRCFDQFGNGEAYLPVLEALGRLMRTPVAGELEIVLQRHAPTWLRQLSAVVSSRRRPSCRSPNLAPSRMMREIADALEVFCATRTLVLVIEDLQWSDSSTIALLGYLARRREPGRILVIGSARVAELMAEDNPLRELRQALRLDNVCEELPVDLLSLEEVATYVAFRFAGASAAALKGLAAQVHRHTEGNPLFMVNMISDAVERGVIVRQGERWRIQGRADRFSECVPATLKEMIFQRMATWSPADRGVLEIASVVGDEFAAVDVAAALHERLDVVESICERFALRSGFLLAAGVLESPNGSVTGRYRFVHALYRRVIYESIGAARRVRAHRAIGAAQARRFGRNAMDHATELAVHFSLGRDYRKALELHEHAGFAALDREAAGEGAMHFSAALEALDRVREAADAGERELRLVMARANLSMAIHGYAAADTERDFERARALSCGDCEDAALAPVLRGLLSFHHVRGALDEARDLGERLLRLAERNSSDEALRLQAHYGNGATLFHQGALAEAEIHLKAALALYRPENHAVHARSYGGYDPGVGASMWLAWTLALRGRLREALDRDRSGLALARSLPSTFSLAWGCYAASVSRQLFGDWNGSASLAAEANEIAEEHGFSYVAALAGVNLSWAQIMLGNRTDAVAGLRDGVAAVEATGARLVHPSYLGMLAAVDAMLGDRVAAERGFDSALSEIEETGERLHEATLLIGKSHFLSAGGVGGRAPRAHAGAAETCLRRALSVARAQGARLVELRAAVALARHRRARGDAAGARRELEIVCEWFAEQPRVAEVEAARQLLADSDA
jgi:tetratricopeptide (TPR) repeat protein